MEGLEEDYYPEDGDWDWGENGTGAGNGTGCEWPADWEVSFWLLPALYLLVFALGLAGNGLVLASVWPGRGRGRGRASDAYIGHLALADLAFVVTLPLWAAYTALRFHWPFGSGLCKLSSYLVLLGLFASAFCLAGLSLQRCRALARPRPGPAPGPGPGPGRPLAALWLLAALLALPALLLRDTRPAGPAVLCDLQLGGLGGPRAERLWLGGLSLAATGLGFALPLLLMSLGYGRLAAALRRPLRPRPRRRLLRTLAGLVAAFALCWLPFHLLKSLYVLSGLGLLRLPCAFLGLALLLHPYATCLAYLNSCLNPLLYAFLQPRFRARARRLLRFPPRPGPGPAPPASSSSSSGPSAHTQKSDLHSLATKV